MGRAPIVAAVVHLNAPLAPPAGGQFATDLAAPTVVNAETCAPTLCSREPLVGHVDAIASTIGSDLATAIRIGPTPPRPGYVGGLAAYIERVR